MKREFLSQVKTQSTEFFKWMVDSGETGGRFYGALRGGLFEILAHDMLSSAVNRFVLECMRIGMASTR